MEPAPSRRSGPVKESVSMPNLGDVMHAEIGLAGRVAVEGGFRKHFVRQQKQKQGSMQQKDSSSSETSYVSAARPSVWLQGVIPSFGESTGSSTNLSTGISSPFVPSHVQAAVAADQIAPELARQLLSRALASWQPPLEAVSYEIAAQLLNVAIETATSTCTGGVPSVQRIGASALESAARQTRSASTACGAVRRRFVVTVAHPNAARDARRTPLDKRQGSLVSRSSRFEVARAKEKQLPHNTSGRGPSRSSSVSADDGRVLYEVDSNMSDASRTSPTPSWSSNAGTLYYNGGSTSAGALNGGSHDNEQDGVTTQQDGELLYDVNASACSFTAFLQGLIGSPCQRQGPSQLALLLQLLEAKKEQLVAENTLLERHNHSLRDALTSSCSLELGGVQQLETVFHESAKLLNKYSASGAPGGEVGASPGAAGAVGTGVQLRTARFIGAMKPMIVMFPPATLSGSTSTRTL
ncbi:hypothetical protein AB1Y20_012730 [Prymnesium parvum]|uniref:Uncharacterized protein n=1 Tax=Prymnesium parvum TaxID=97485 RepID=A0AB34IM70_PRYPA